MIAPGDWWRLAACQTAEPDLFFPISAAGRAEVDVARARAVCQHCRVRTKCLDYALVTRQVHGIWGGLTEEERRRYLLQQRRADLTASPRAGPAGLGSGERPTPAGAGAGGT